MTTHCECALYNIMYTYISRLNWFTQSCTHNKGDSLSAVTLNTHTHFYAY